MLRDLILSIIAFSLVAFVLAIVAARNKLIPPAVVTAAESEWKTVESHNSVHPAWFSALWKHMVDWLEIYWYFPLSIIAVFASAKLVFLLSGRQSIEDPNALVGFALKAPPLVAALCVMTITRQASAHWLSAEEAKANIPLTVVYHTKDVLIFALVLYFWLH